MSRFRIAAAGSALLLALAACGGDAETATTAEPSNSGADAAAAPVEPAITGSFATVAGGQLDLGALEGQDTVLWFWAPW